MEDNTLLLQNQVVLPANALRTLYVTSLYSKCIQSIYSHILANIESFADYFKIISSCLLTERRKGLVTIILSEVNIDLNHDIKFVYKQTYFNIY